MLASMKRFTIMCSLKVICILLCISVCGSGAYAGKTYNQELYSINDYNIICLSNNHIYLHRYDEVKGNHIIECRLSTDGSKVWEFKPDGIIIRHTYQNPHSIDEEYFPILIWENGNITLYVINNSGNIENAFDINPNGIDYPEPYCYVAHGVVYYFQVDKQSTIGLDYLTNDIVWSLRDDSAIGCCDFPSLLEVDGNNRLIWTSNRWLKYLHNNDIIWGKNITNDRKIMCSFFSIGENNIIHGVKDKSKPLYYIRILDKKTGELIRDFGRSNCSYQYILQDKSIYFTIHEIDCELHDNTSSNILHKMNIDTLDEEWRLNLGDLDIHVGTNRFDYRFIGNNLYLKCSDNNTAKELGIVYNVIVCIDIDTGNLIQSFKFDESIEKFSVTNEYLFIETKEGVSCYDLNSNDKLLENTNINLKFQLGKKHYSANNDIYDMDVSPIVINDRTLLPARYVVEPLGGQVFWDGEQRKVTCKLLAPDNPDTDEYKENIVELWIDNPIAKVNGEEVQIDPYNPDVVPTIINDRTMVPMRFLAESLGCEVEWVADTKEIILTYSP